VIESRKDVLVTLKLRLPSMTKVLKRIGGFIQQEPEQVILMSINELADASDASIASVMRLHKELDFTSFASFKLALASELAVQANKVVTNHRSATKLSRTEQVGNSLCEVIRMNVDLIKSAEMEEIAQRVIDSRLIMLHGLGASHIPARFLYYKLTRLGFMCHLSTDHHMTSVVANARGTDDMLLMFSSSGSVRESIELAKLANERSVQTIAFTNRFKSPLGDVCDKQLVTMGSESPLSSGSLESKIGLLLIVELLFDTICSISEVHAQRIGDAANAVINELY
jgi:RpiR family carbohydrate utilization transcriptional regulator